MQTRDEIRQQVQTDIRNAVRDASNAARAAAEEAARAPAAAGQATTTEPAGFGGPPVMPPDVKAISIWFFLTVGVTIIALAAIRPWARWLDRRGHAPHPSSDVGPRLDRIEQAIEAVAIEVERISEGQRYASKLMSEVRVLPAPVANDPWSKVPQREPVPVRRQGEE